MTPYRKKLIEVGLPLVAINAESAREKSIRHGHPSTLHLWWARRPLAACRAVLFASLVDDPDSDPQYFGANGKVDEEAAGIKRADLFNLIEELVMWENSNNSDVIRTARAEIARCVASRLIETGALKKETSIGAKTTAYDLVKHGHCRPIPLGLDKKVGRVRFSFDVSRLPPTEVVNAFLAKHGPPVLDPFCGGGSIPLEAQRLGLRAYASDLNPVPVLINKALIEIPPKFAGRPPVNPESLGGTSATNGKGKKQRSLVEKEWPGATGLAEDVRYYGQWMRDEAEKRIGHLYPKVEVTAEMAQHRPDLVPYVGQQLTVIAWLWARTVASPNPAANGAHVPLVRSFCLSTKKGKEAYVKPVVERSNSDIGFEVRIGQPPNGADPTIGTVNRNGAVCLLTNSPIPLDHIRSEGKAGHLGARLIAIVVDGGKSRIYLSPTRHDESIANDAVPPDDIPDSDLPVAALGFRVQNYGMTKHRHLFTSRQLVALGAFSNLVREVRNQVVIDTAGDQSYANAIALYAACAVSRAADYWSSLATWEVSAEFIGHTFTKQTLSMVWDYAECNPLSSATGNWLGATEWVSRVIERLPADAHGQVDQKDAAKLDGHGFLISTDPPYYDNVPYADLSDFFYVWLRRALQADYPDLLKTVLVPKAEELIAEPFRHGSKDGARKFFEDGMGQVFAWGVIAPFPVIMQLFSTFGLPRPDYLPV